MSPTSGTFRELCGASLGYGLTEGGPNATTISLTPLGQRIVAPLTEGDDTRALRQAVLTPTVEKGFLAKYDGSPLPAEKIGCNVLETMGVPADATGRVLTLIVENARSVNFLKVIKDKTYVDLEGARTIDSLPAPASGGVGDLAEGATEGSLSFDVDPDTVRPSFSPTPTSSLPKRNRRVFVSHGKSRRVVDQLKELLSFGDFEPVVSVEQETVSKPVPQKVLDDMRTCGAGIIHVKPEDRFLDETGTERRILNQNVLIEIGAAMALYGEHFILLVEDGATLPSNLQGLYEVRYAGDELGYDATMKVLKALNQFKTTQG
jgi:predicted nucleotide-binding protein